MNVVNKNCIIVVLQCCDKREIFTCSRIILIHNIFRKLIDTMNLTGNTTVTARNYDYEYVIYNIIHPILGTIVIAFNTMVVCSSGLLLKSGPKSQKKSTIMFLGNLALTEILNVVITQWKLWYVVTEKSSIYICILLVGMKVLPYITNMYSIGLIALDRYLYIYYGMQYEKWVYPKRTRILIIMTWILGLIMACLPFVWNKSKRTNDSKLCFVSQIAPKEYILVMLVLSLIPIILVVTFYAKILCKAIHKINDLDNSERPSNEHRFVRTHVGRSLNSLPESDDTNQESGSMWTIFRLTTSITTRKKLNAIKIVLLTTSCFVLTWLPFTVTYAVYVYNCQTPEEKSTKMCKILIQVLRMPFLILGTVHGIVNPIIYAWWHKGFRSYWLKKLRLFFKRPEPL